MYQVYVHSHSRFGGKLMPPEIFNKLQAEGVIYAEHKGEHTFWCFKPLKQAIEQRKRRKIFTNG